MLALGAQARTQALMASDQAIERLLQGCAVELALQAHGHGQVVGSALRVQLPEKRHASLGIGQPIAVIAGDIGRDRKHGKVDALCL
ncbi:hypothetical protein D3C76_1536280 [compost metagenome]